MTTPWNDIRNRRISTSPPRLVEVDEEEEEEKEPELPKYEETELNYLRAQLFESGSDFKKTSRNEIVGIENVLLEIDGVIHWLRNSEVYSNLGARLEPGVLFSGIPGSGKTLVARYIASESNALFVNVRDFPHNGSFLHDSDIAAIFTFARMTYAITHRPIILFWDEFEGGAKERSRDGVSPDQAASISQLTAELDGIHGKNEGVLLIGCTNYDYMIDHALLRPGRMGLHIEFNAPDREGKEKLLGHYLGKVNTQGDINLETLSYFFDDEDTAASVEEAVNEGWRVAVMKQIKSAEAARVPLWELTKKDMWLTEADLIDVFLNRLIGPPPTFVNLVNENLLSLAIHETGHALAALIWQVPLRLITVKPGKKALGRTFIAKVDHHLGKISEQRANLRVGIGGLVAEDITGIGRSIGSTRDTQGITNIASQLVDIHGEGKLSGLFNTNGFTDRYEIEPSISPYLLEQKDRDMTHEIDLARQDVTLAFENIGGEHISKIAEILVEKLTMTGEQFVEVVYEVIGDPVRFKR